MMPFQCISSSTEFSPQIAEIGPIFFKSRFSAPAREHLKCHGDTFLLVAHCKLQWMPWFTKKRGEGNKFWMEKRKSISCIVAVFRSCSQTIMIIDPRLPRTPRSKQTGRFQLQEALYKLWVFSFFIIIIIIEISIWIGWLASLCLSFIQLVSPFWHISASCQ